jgi:hypothetical protein
MPSRSAGHMRWAAGYCEAFSDLSPYNRCTLSPGIFGKLRSSRVAML